MPPTLPPALPPMPPAPAAPMMPRPGSPRVPRTIPFNNMLGRTGRFNPALGDFIRLVDFGWWIWRYSRGYGFIYGAGYDNYDLQCGFKTENRMDRGTCIFLNSGLFLANPFPIVTDPNAGQIFYYTDLRTDTVPTYSGIMRGMSTRPVTDPAFYPFTTIPTGPGPVPDVPPIVPWIGIPYKGDVMGDPLPTPQRGNGPDPNPPPPVAPVPRVPPGPGKKERKFSTGLQKAAWAIQKAYHGLTEVNDWEGALFNALPKTVRQKSKCNKADIACKAKALYDNWDKLDLQTALFELAWNAASDQFTGFTLKGVPKANQQAMGLLLQNAQQAGAQLTGLTKQQARDLLNSQGWDIKK